MVPEEKLTEFVERCREAAGSNLETLVLFGSAVTGEYHAGLSDLNLLCVLRDSSFAKLQELAPVVRWWNGQKQAPPLCMTRHELGRSTDVFTIELIDMVQHHRILFGEDVLQRLQIPTDLHRVQVEYELREKLLLLRQHLLMSAGNDKQMWEVLLHSVPSFATLFRHALMVLEKGASLRRREAVKQLAQRLQFNPTPIEQLMEVRERKIEKKNLEAATLCVGYLAAIEKVTSAVDALDPETPAGTRSK
ncbi:MAG TPA: nucleotidyltransferase domain-containing protein [Candidatus Sulfotelmatobacter sp.]|nr:nucleotidyltransferase domain-containing protein [Candidatus Sulfotelmatobacter sp.]